MKYQNKKVIHGMVDLDTVNDLELLAQHHHCSVASIMRRAFVEYLKNYEELLNELKCSK